MYFVRVGWRTVNLEYLIEAADAELGAPASEAPPGGIRASIYPGKHFDVTGDAASNLRLHLDDNLKPLPSHRAKRDGNHGARAKGARAREVPSPSPKSSPKEE